MMVAARVVLPIPDRPTTATDSPVATVRFTSDSTGWPPGHPTVNPSMTREGSSSDAPAVGESPVPTCGASNTSTTRSSAALARVWVWAAPVKAPNTSWRASGVRTSTASVRAPIRPSATALPPIHRAETTARPAARICPAVPSPRPQAALRSAARSRESTSSTSARMAS